MSGEIDEQAKTKLWVRRKPGKFMRAPGAVRDCEADAEVTRQEVQDLPCLFVPVMVRIDLRCPDCGIKIKKVPQLPSKAPFSKRFEDAVAVQSRGGANRVAKQFGLARSTVRSIDLRYLGGGHDRRKPVLARKWAWMNHLRGKSKGNSLPW